MNFMELESTLVVISNDWVVRAMYVSRTSLKSSCVQESQRKLHDMAITTQGWSTLTIPKKLRVFSRVKTMEIGRGIFTNSPKFYVVANNF